MPSAGSPTLLEEAGNQPPPGYPRGRPAGRWWSGRPCHRAVALAELGRRPDPAGAPVRRRTAVEQLRWGPGPRPAGVRRDLPRSTCFSPASRCMPAMTAASWSAGPAAAHHPPTSTPIWNALADRRISGVLLGPRAVQTTDDPAGKQPAGPATKFADIPERPARGGDPAAAADVGGASATGRISLEQFRQPDPPPARPRTLRPLSTKRHRLAVGSDGRPGDLGYRKPSG